VCEVFTGPQSQDGSAMRKTESKTARAIDAVRREYEAIANIPLRVKLVGDACAENLALVVPALVAGDFASKPIAHQAVITPNTGLRAGLRMYVTKALRPEWFSVNDRWMGRSRSKATDCCGRYGEVKETVAIPTGRGLGRSPSGSGGSYQQQRKANAEGTDSPEIARISGSVLLPLSRERHDIWSRDVVALTRWGQKRA
jgi:hypothetical protein